jgi:hypothetical protein
MIFNKENIFNKDGFIWWIGVCEDRKEDPDKLGRIKVRIMGYHTDDKEALPTDQLPWAIIMQPTTSAGVSGVGHSPTAIMEGTWCVGFFLDGNDKQQPIVIGTFGGYTQKVPFCGQVPNYLTTDIEPADLQVTNTVFDENGDPVLGGDTTQAVQEYISNQAEGEAWAQENEILQLETEAFQDPNAEFPRCDYIDKPDTNFLATGDVLETETAYSKKLDNREIYGLEIPVALSGDTWDEPEPAYCTEYPYNIVYETEAGHVVEFDQTPDHERIHIFHKTGTYIEIDANSTMVRKVMGDNYEVLEGNDYKAVKGHMTLTVQNGMQIYVQGRCDIQVDGDTNIKVNDGDVKAEVTGGKVDLKVDDNINIEAGGDFNLLAENVNIQARNDINLYAQNINNYAEMKYSVLSNFIGMKAAVNATLWGAGQSSLIGGEQATVQAGVVSLAGVPAGWMPKGSSLPGIQVNAAMAGTAAPPETPDETNLEPETEKRLDCFLETPEYPEDPEPPELIVIGSDSISEIPESFTYEPTSDTAYEVPTIDAVEPEIGNAFTESDIYNVRELTANLTIGGGFNLDNLV